MHTKDHQSFLLSLSGRKIGPFVFDDIFRVIFAASFQLCMVWRKKNSQLRTFFLMRKYWKGVWKSLETEFFGMKNITKVMPIFSVLSYYSYYEKSIIDLKYPPEFVIFVIDTKKKESWNQNSRKIFFKKVWKVIFALFVI